MINVGIIGLGVGEKHIAGYQAHPGCRVVALCDFDRKKLKQAKAKYPSIKLTARAEEILSDKTIQAVSIASYDSDHHAQIVQALKNGKHVFVEKPVCLFEREARDILKRLKQYPSLKLSSNLILRKCPRFIWLKEKIRKGAMGKLYQLEGDYNYGRLEKVAKGWRGKLDFYSAVYGGGVHMIDLLMWMSGQKIVEVCAYGNKISSQGTRFKYNDLIASIFKFENGMTGKMTVNFGSVARHFHPLAIYGTKASFQNVSHDYATWSTSRDPKVAPKKVTEAYPGAHKGDMLKSFIDAIIKEKKPDVSVGDIFDTMAVCFAIEKSVNTGRAVRVNYLT
jgi:predicted dehydrogenase